MAWKQRRIESSRRKEMAWKRRRIETSNCDSNVTCGDVRCSLSTVWN